MKNLIFVGGGGFFGELYDYISQDTLFLSDKKIKGIIDDKVLSGSELPYLGSVEDYQIKVDDVFLIAIGNAAARQKVYAILRSKKANVISYVHPLAFVAPTCRVGTGVIVCPYSIMNANSVVKDNVVLNVFCSVGHDSIIGMHTVMSPYSAVNGAATVGEGVFLATRATVFPAVKVGDWCIVDSHSFVKKDVGDKQIISNRSEYLVTNNRFLR